MKKIETIDLHMHTTVSDGTDTPEEILSRVRDAGIRLFSVTDHDAIKAAGIIPGILSDGDPAFLPGVELSCRDGEGKYHILGYGYDPAASAINTVVSDGHRRRIDKVKYRLAALRKEYGFTFPEKELEKLFSLYNPGKPHIGNLMVKLGYVKTRDEAIRDYLNKIRTPSVYLRPEEAIEAILASGGVPVLAHPTYGSGEELILGEEMDERLKRLTGFGLKGVEIFYSPSCSALRRNMICISRPGATITAATSSSSWATPASRRIRPSRRGCGASSTRWLACAWPDLAARVRLRFWRGAEKTWRQRNGTRLRGTRPALSCSRTMCRGSCRRSAIFRPIIS